MSLLGLVRHMAEVERWWFRRFRGESAAPYLYCTEDSNEDGDFDDTDPAGAAEDFATFERECRLARDAVAGASLEETFHSRRGNDISLRWVFTHMIEEYARHNGHADLLRERIDGVTGD
jgi:uncharacterized damage-inducible protein DinB